LKREDGAADFRPDEAFARELDAADPLAGYRSRFEFPAGSGKAPVVYFCGNSLGLQPSAVRAWIEQELDDWARLAVDAHFDGATPWYSYHAGFREPCARLVGAHPDEVVVMNGLTTNLHLMLVSFYRPTAARHAILMEDNAFPSDTYAVQSQIRHHGYDPQDSLLVARPDPGRAVLRTEAIEELLERHGKKISVVLLGAVNYYTGQAFDLERIAAAARAQGCVVGYDLAHAAGNLEMRLSDWDVDFAVWCSYKYLNAGPGGVAGCFVHRRHSQRKDLNRFAGWWGNDPERRFRMHLESEFVPVAGADGWQLSNPPILALAPLAASLELFDEVGMPALRSKSRRLTAFLEYHVRRSGGDTVEQLTPTDPDERGCQLSLLVRDGARELFAELKAADVVVDYREPGVIRVAPVPLYNSFHDVWLFGRVLEHWGRRVATTAQSNPDEGPL